MPIKTRKRSTVNSKKLIFCVGRTGHGNPAAPYGPYKVHRCRDSDPEYKEMINFLAEHVHEHFQNDHAIQHYCFVLSHPYCVDHDLSAQELVDSLYKRLSEFANGEPLSRNSRWAIRPIQADGVMPATRDEFKSAGCLVLVYHKNGKSGGAS